MPPYQQNRRDKKPMKKVAKRDPIYIDGRPPRPMYVDYTDLDLLSKPPKSDDETPVLRMLRGAARGVPADAHRRHLSRKYR